MSVDAPPGPDSRRTAVPGSPRAGQGPRDSNDPGFASTATGRRESALAAELSAAIPPGWVADLGCGAGRLLPSLARPGRSLVGVDRDITQLCRARSAAPGRIELVRADLERWPFREGVFAGACLVRAVHLVSDPARLFREVARSLRCGGGFILTNHPPGTLRGVEIGVRRALRSPGWGGRRPAGAISHPRAPAGWSNASLGRWAREAGLVPEAARGSGAEELPVVRWLERRPEGMEPLWAALPWQPMRWMMWRKADVRGGRAAGVPRPTPGPRTPRGSTR